MTVPVKVGGVSLSGDIISHMSGIRPGLDASSFTHTFTQFSVDNLPTCMFLGQWEVTCEPGGNQPLVVLSGNVSSVVESSFTSESPITMTNLPESGCQDTPKTCTETDLPLSLKCQTSLVGYCENLQLGSFQVGSSGP